jgi:hypothetical protein
VSQQPGQKDDLAHIGHDHREIAALVARIEVPPSAQPDPKLTKSRADDGAELQRQRGRLHSFGRTHEQPIGEVIAKPAHRIAGGRLREAQLFGGCRHILPPPHGLKDGQEIEVDPIGIHQVNIVYQIFGLYK